MQVREMISGLSICVHCHNGPCDVARGPCLVRTVDCKTMGHQSSLSTATAEVALKTRNELIQRSFTGICNISQPHFVCWNAATHTGIVTEYMITQCHP